MPQSLAWRTRSANAADSSRALVGMQPRCRHVPPILSSSTSATFSPSWAARKAAVYPPVPAPSTTRSKSLDEPTAMGQGASGSRRPGLGGRAPACRAGGWVIDAMVRVASRGAQPMAGHVPGRRGMDQWRADAPPRAESPPVWYDIGPGDRARLPPTRRAHTGVGAPFGPLWEEVRRGRGMTGRPHRRPLPRVLQAPRGAVPRAPLTLRRLPAAARMIVGSSRPTRPRSDVPPPHFLEGP